MSREHIEDREFVKNIATAYASFGAVIPLVLVDAWKDSERDKFKFDPQYLAGVQADPVRSAFYFNSGDTGNAFDISLLAGFILDAKFPDMSERRKRTLSFAAGAGAVVLAELTGFLNTPEVGDIPAGFLGSLLYLGVRHLIGELFIQRQIQPTTSAEQIV